MKVLGLGNALVDILVQLDDDKIIDALNIPKGSMQLISADDIPGISNTISPYPAHMVSGGSAANTIHGLACLGIPCGFVGKVGSDELGKFYANDLKAAKIEATLLPSDTVTGRAYTLITPDTERTFVTYLGAAVEMDASELDINLFRNYSTMHIEGYLVQNTELIEKAMQIAKANNLKISLDLASFNVVEANLLFLQRVIPEYVDIVFANEEEARSYTGKTPEEALQILGNQTEIAIVKIGKEGSLVISKGQVENVGIISVDSVDTTGAGDQYAAGFLYGLSEGLSLQKCGQIGALLAGTVIENYGARIQDSLWKDMLNEVEKIKKS